MIFNLFNSKPTLKELIPNGFVDIHSHILPGIDDGAKDINESLLLISLMKEMGFSKIIGTPHTYPGLYDNTNKSIKRSYKELIHNLEGKKNIEFASEYMADVSILDKIKKEEILTIGNKFILMETGFQTMPNHLFDLVFEIRLKGFTPIIAHPERYLYMFDNLKIIEKLKKMGCFFQINLLSSTGYYGSKVIRFCDYLLKNNMIDFVGSDIHNIRHIEEFENKIKIKNILEFNEVIERNKIFK